MLHRRAKNFYIYPNLLLLLFQVKNNLWYLCNSIRNQLDDEVFKTVVYYPEITDFNHLQLRRNELRQYPKICFVVVDYGKLFRYDFHSFHVLNCCSLQNNSRAIQIGVKLNSMNHRFNISMFLYLKQKNINLMNLLVSQRQELTETVSVLLVLSREAWLKLFVRSHFQ